MHIPNVSRATKIWLLSAVCLALLLLVTTVIQPAQAAPDNQAVPPYDNEWPKETNGPGGPRADAIVFRVITQPDAQIMALLKGEIDMVGWPAPPEQIPQLKEYEKKGLIKLFYAEENSLFYLAFNFRRYPFQQCFDPNDPEGTYDRAALALRRAISYLVDRDYILNKILKGYGKITPSVVPPWTGRWYDPKVKELYEWTHKYDPDKARDLLRSAGFEDTDGTGWLNDPRTGRDLPTMYLYTPSYDPIRVQVGDLIASACQSVGIPVYNKPIDFNSLVNLVFDAHDFDLYILGWLLGREPLWLYYLFHSNQDVPGGNNAPGIHNATLDDNLTKIWEATTPDEMEEAVYNAQRIIAEQVAYIPLYYRIQVVPCSARWEGYFVEPLGGPANFWTFLQVHPRDTPTGGVFRFALLDRVRTLDYWAASSVWDWYVLGLLFESPIAIEPFNYTEIPWLANFTVEETDGGLVITFNFGRKDVMFHDGTPLTVEHYARTLDYINRTAGKLPGAEEWTYVGYLRYEFIPGNDTAIRLYFSRKSYWALRIAGGTAVLPMHYWWKDWPTCTEVRDPYSPGLTDKELTCGSGPYIFKELHPDYVVLVKNDNYWRKKLIQPSKAVPPPPPGVWNLEQPQGQPAEDPSRAIAERASSSIKELVRLMWITSLGTAVIGCGIVAAVAFFVRRRTG